MFATCCTRLIHIHDMTHVVVSYIYSRPVVHDSYIFTFYIYIHACTFTLLMRALLPINTCEWGCIHVSCIHVSCHLRMSHGTRMNESYHTCHWVILRCPYTCIALPICMCHVTRTNASGLISKCTLWHIWVSHGTHMSESWHTYEWVMAHKQLTESCHTHERVMSHMCLDAGKLLKIHFPCCKKDLFFQASFPKEPWQKNSNKRALIM